MTAPAAPKPPRFPRIHSSAAKNAGRLRRSRQAAAQAAARLGDDDDDVPLTGVVTATSQGLLSCHACDTVSARTLEGGPCPRCGATLHWRKPDSLARTWAFLLSAMILYVPANLLPVMVTTSILGTQQDTIFSGVMYLWITGSHLLAIIVLIASIVVPMMKMVILLYLLLSVHFRARWRPRQRSRLFSLVEIVGRWSMLDIFVVALLAALVRAGALATIIPGSGAAAFGTVVVLTMLASLSFDPRLIWDAVDRPDGKSTDPGHPPHAPAHSPAEAPSPPATSHHPAPVATAHEHTAPRDPRHV